MVFLVLLIAPIIICVLTFVVLKTISAKELLLQFGSAILIAGVSAGLMSCVSTHDTEILSGSVISKQQTRVSCSHSYSCRCRNSCSGSGKNKSCHRVCDTCYDHSHDYDWDVDTTVGNIEIDRIDRQGVHEPPRWSAVFVGEPVVTTHGYDNYIKAAPDSLFRHQGSLEKYKGQIPEYPNDVYDYYKINRLVTVGFRLENEARWNESLMVLNADLGAKKQVNAIIVIVKNKPHDYYYALEQAWIGGKKNDAILVLSVDEQLKPQWAKVMTWTTNKVFEIKLRDAIMAQEQISLLSTMRILHSSIDQFYKRKPMKDFEYLESSITPSTTSWVVSMIIQLIFSLGIAFICHRNDVFGDENMFSRF